MMSQRTLDNIDNELYRLKNQKYTEQLKGIGTFLSDSPLPLGSDKSFLRTQFLDKHKKHC